MVYLHTFRLVDFYGNIVDKYTIHESYGQRSVAFPKALDVLFTSVLLHPAATCQALGIWHFLD